MKTKAEKKGDAEMPMTLKNLLKVSEDKLSESGFRLTSARKEILKTLIASPNPLTTLQIFEQTKQHVKIDRVSAYRVIEVFKKLGLIHLVGDAGFVFCSHVQENNDAHLYLLCDECKEVQEIEFPDTLKASIAKQASAKGNFRNKGPIQVSGVCKKCD